MVVSTLLFLGGTQPVRGQEFIFNGDFEEDADQWVVWPGYVGAIDDGNPDFFNPNEINEWFHSGGIGINPVQPGAGQNPSSINGYIGTGGHGVNPVDDPTAADLTPFRDNGENDTTVAFLQGTATLQKDVSGLTIGGNYLLSLEYNARNCCGDFPMPTLSLNGVLVPDFPDPGDSPDGVVLPVGDINPWYFTEIPFTAESSDLSILISTQSELAGDSTFLVDNLELVLSGSNENLIENGDFEADEGVFQNWPGYVEDDAQRAPFRDNGNNTTAVAFMQGTASLEQDISGLTVGEEYVLSFDYNARNCCGDIPIADVTLDDQPLDDFPGIDGVDPVGAGNDWYRYETTVVADRTTMTLRFSSFPAAGGDATFVLDNVSFRAAGAMLPGDFNGNGVLDAEDINDLTGQSASMTNDAFYDLNADALVNEADIKVWVKDLFNSWIGDANLDGEFSSADLVAVLGAGTYETGLPSVWTTGDFNGDGVTGSADLVAALSDGGYELGPRAAVAAVPEPSSVTLTILALGLLGLRRPCRRP